MSSGTGPRRPRTDREIGVESDVRSRCLRKNLRTKTCEGGYIVETRTTKETYHSQAKGEMVHQRLRSLPQYRSSSEGWEARSNPGYCTRVAWCTEETSCGSQRQSGNNHSNKRSTGKRVIWIRGTLILDPVKTESWEKGSRSGDGPYHSWVIYKRFIYFLSVKISKVGLTSKRVKNLNKRLCTQTYSS